MRACCRTCCGVMLVVLCIAGCCRGTRDQRRRGGGHSVKTTARGMGVRARCCRAAGSSACVCCVRRGSGQLRCARNQQGGRATKELVLLFSARWSRHGRGHYQCVGSCACKWTCARVPVRNGRQTVRIPPQYRVIVRRSACVSAPAVASVGRERQHNGRLRQDDASVRVHQPESCPPASVWG